MPEKLSDNKSDKKTDKKTDKKSEKKARKKQSQRNSHATTSAVFRLKPDNWSNSATILYVGALKENEKLGDEVIELDKVIHPDHTLVGKHAIPINKVGEFEIVGRLFKCNIVGSHIVMSSRYPLLHLNIHYDRAMVAGSLFQIFYTIEIDKEQKDAVKDTRKYVNMHFSGQWYRNIDCDDELIANYESTLVEMLESEAADLFYRSEDLEFDRMRCTLSEEQIVEWIETYVVRERQFYDSIMKEQPIQFTSMTKVRDELVELCTSVKFYKFVKLAMKCRDQHRRNKYGVDDESMYVVPKNVTKMVDIQNQLIENNELDLDTDD